MQLHEMNLWQVMIFRLYILYNKHKMIKFGTQNREISQVLSQVLEYFFCRLYLTSIHPFLLAESRKNSTRTAIWAFFGPVSRAFIGLQANDSRFLSMPLFALNIKVVSPSFYEMIKMLINLSTGTGPAASAS